MTKKILMCILSLFSCIALSQAYAESPNLYNCRGNNVALSFRTFSFGPVTTTTRFLTLDIGNKRYTAGNANIETKKTVMGDVKTITLKIIPDLEIRKASFILPEINLGQNFLGDFVDKVSFKSQLVLTNIATPFIAPPYVGVVNKSNYIDLNCTASLVLVPL